MSSILSRLAGEGLYPIAQRPGCQSATVEIMFRLVATMRRGSATALPQAAAAYASMEAARLGAAELLREDRILKVMIVKNAFPGGFVEWIDR
jgi:hypothetical protein